MSAEAQPAPEPLTSWPPEGAEPLPTEDLYERLAEIGFDYGPAFQGLTAAWQDGEEIYAEVSLPEEQREVASRFAIHPALLDSAFHAGLGLALAGEGKPTLPFDWHAIRVLDPGAPSLRVRLSMQKDRLQLLATDSTGMPVVEVGSVYGRQIEQDQLTSRSQQGSLYRLEWQELSSPEAGDPEATLIDIREWELSDDPVASSHAAAAKALELIQAHLGDEQLAESHLVFVTEGALDTGETEPSLPAATLAGLLRSAQSEHPGRIGLVDVDGSDASTEALQSAIAATATEPQLALREGEAFVPRLAEAKGVANETDGDETPSLDPEKTILITGATGGLGALFARHLAERHGARHLLLLSRSGEKAKGAIEFKAELEELGAEATIAACDVSDLEQLEQLIDGLPAEHPLGAVIHAAGVFDNGLIADLDPERLAKVMAPKVDAAWNLHELTRDVELSHFILFSSAAGLLGGAGQGNYAAANSFLDALASTRKRQGLPATSLAWGLWAQESNLAGEMSEAQLEQVLRQTRMLLGFAPIPAEQGLELFEQTISVGDSLLAPVYFDRVALRAQAKAGSLPALMRRLVRVRPASRRERGWLLPRLASATEGDRGQILQEAMRAQLAASLGHASPDAVDLQSTFPELGFDSLASLEIRDWLNNATRLNLPASVLFDFPTLGSLAEYIDQQLDAVVDSADPAGPAREPQPSESVSLGSLYARAEAAGRGGEGVALLAMAAQLRPSFDLDAHQDHLPRPSQLASGPSGLKLICIPSLLAVGGPHQYVRFAQHLEGKRDVAALPIPGYLSGEQLPADLQVAVRTQAAAIQQCADGEPYALLGHSTGGLFAHIVAEYLDSIDAPPDGVIKVDTYSTAGFADITPHALAGMKQREGSHFELTDHRLTAMVSYRGLVEGCDPGAIRSAGLFVKATDPMPGMSADDMQQARWDGAEATVEVPGDHFTMMEEYASHIADAVDEWCSALIASRSTDADLDNVPTPNQ